MALVAMAAASSSLLAQALTTSCSVEIRKGMSFDLTPLRRGEVTANGVYVADSSSMYAVNDTAGAGAGREYRYNFNFCGAVEPSQQCEGKNYLSPLPAFQTDIEDDGFCYSLSNQTKYGWQFASYGEARRDWCSRAFCAASLATFRLPARPLAPLPRRETQRRAHSSARRAHEWDPRAGPSPRLGREPGLALSRPCCPRAFVALALHCLQMSGSRPAASPFPTWAVAPMAATTRTGTP